MSAPSASLRELFLAKTWLRVESMPDAAPVEYPAAYLFKIAVNVAEDQRRGSARLLSMEELEELYELADEAGPVREVEGRQLAALEAALAELPRRRQAIVIAARVDEVPHREIAERFGISVRTVEKELRAWSIAAGNWKKSMSNASVPGPANRLRDMAAMFTRKNLQLALREARPGCCGWRPGRPQGRWRGVPAVVRTKRRACARLQGDPRRLAALQPPPARARRADGARATAGVRAGHRGRCAAFRQWCGQSVEHARFKDPRRLAGAAAGRRARAPSDGARASQGAGAAPLPGAHWRPAALLAFRPPLDLWPAVSELAADYPAPANSGGGAGRGRHRADEHRTHINVSAQAQAGSGPAGWRGRAARRRAAGQPVGGAGSVTVRDACVNVRHGRPGARDLPGGVARVRGPGGELALAAPRQVLLGADGLGAARDPIWPPSAVGGAACWSSTTCRWRRSWTRSTATARAASC